MKARRFTVGKIYSIEELREIVTPVAQKYKINKIYLFGSYARNSATSQSDIDLYIPQLPQNIGLSYFGMIETLKEKFQKEIDIITDSSEFLSDDERVEFMKEVMKDRVILYKQG